MLREFLIAKIHRATVVETDLNYSGSITIDKDLLDASGMKPYEKVDIYDINNGNRFSTYILEGERGSRVIGINGAAARLVQPGDKVIIVNFGMLDENESVSHKPKVLIMNDHNEVIEVIDYDC